MHLDAAALRAWSQPGWIKAGMEFRLEPVSAGKPFCAGAGHRLPLRLTNTKSLARADRCSSPTRPVNPPGAQPSRTGSSAPRVQGELAVDTPRILGDSERMAGIAGDQA